MKKRFLIPLVLCGCLAAGISSAAVTNSIINMRASVSGPVGQEDLFARTEGVSGDGSVQTKEDRDSVIKSAGMDRDALKTMQDTGKVKDSVKPSESIPDQSAVQEPDQKVYTQEVTVTEYTFSEKSTDGYVGSVVAVSEEKSVNSEAVANTDVSETKKADNAGKAEQNIKQEPEKEKKTVAAEIAAVAAAATQEEVPVRDNTVSYAKNNTTASTPGNYNPGDGWEMSTQIGTETTRCICITYPKKLVRLIKRTVYYQTGDFKIVEYYKNGKYIDEDDYEDEYEDALEDMWEGKCSMDVSSSQTPIIVRDIVK